MFWKLVIGAATLGAAYLGWQSGGANTAAFAGILALSATLSIRSYLKRKPWPAVVLGTAAIAMVVGHLSGSAWLTAAVAVLSFLGQTAVHDMLQAKHSLERAFPVLAHFRRFAELIRPEIQQYWIERDTEGKPATRDDRSFCYAASKGELTDISFGTKRDYHKPGQIHIRNATFPVPDREPIDLPPIVLGPGRRHPAFIWGRLGVGDMSFGSLGRNAVEALASGAGKAGILLSTGEGGLTPYHLNGVYIKPAFTQYVAWACAYAMSFVSKNWKREPMPRAGYVGSGQIMLEIGTGKFGCRTASGDFDYDRFAAITSNPKVVAVKIKLAQGAKPGGGGILPGVKVTREIAFIRGIPEGKDCVSPNTWSEFNDVPSMMRFIGKLQEISGKPVGIKIVIGEEKFINEVAEWMRDHPGQGPDFIHVDGGEGGTGAAPLMLADFVGAPILHAIPLVDNVLRKNGVRDRVVLMSSGKVFNPGQLLIQLALGSDYVFAARGFMFALGCIQAMKCATGECPAGVTTHHKWLQRALVPRVKYIRVANYAETMHKHLVKLLRVVGVRDTYELTRNHITIVAGTHNEVSGEVAHPYPAGCAQPQVPQIPATFGLEAPAGPPPCAPPQGTLPPPTPEPEPVKEKGDPRGPVLIQLRAPDRR
jgi:glutamate synthase domain-containing protein 2